MAFAPGLNAGASSISFVCSSMLRMSYVSSIPSKTNHSAIVPRV